MMNDEFHRSWAGFARGSALLKGRRPCNFGHRFRVWEADWWQKRLLGLIVEGLAESGIVSVIGFLLDIDILIDIMIDNYVNRQ